ncbi:EfeM/EfeO family lipoprotein [Streptomyces sp. NPDC050610]|uniref:EfeM/EfeO family lipoprotein n=1 Tax=Streptomyces sp. NPDC050610 TaxID=3157097 RepID=UPI003413A75A
MSDPRRALITGLLAAAMAVLAIWAFGALDRPRPHPSASASPTSGNLRHTAIEISPGRCGRGWRDPRPGAQVFDLHNTSDTAAEAYLKDPRTGAVYGEVEGLGPGTTRRLPVRLGAGTYAFACLPDDADAVTGPTVRINDTSGTSGTRGTRGASGAGSTGGPSNAAAGRGRSGPAAVPVTQHDLIPPTLDYQRWVGARTGDLVAGAERLRAAIDGGDRPAARTAWLSAHLGYERMGAAYGAFGDADKAINGTTAGLPGGIRDKGFTGFHRIEYGLWHGEPAARLRPLADRLVNDARTLRDAWSQARMDPQDLGLRAHEILEDTVQFELTGRTDYGSGSNLATARANLDGTRAVLARLRPLLATRYPELPALYGQLDRTQRVLDAQDHDGRWTPLGRLGRAPREKVNAEVSELAERLANVAALCDVRRTS